MAVTLASAGQMLAKRSQTVWEGMQPAERITSGRAWGQVGWPVSPLASHPLRVHSTPATTKPQPSVKRTDRQYTRTPRRSVTAQEARLPLEAYSLSWPGSYSSSEAPSSLLEPPTHIQWFS